MLCEILGPCRFHSYIFCSNISEEIKKSLRISLRFLRLERVRAIKEGEGERERNRRERKGKRQKEQREYLRKKRKEFCYPHQITKIIPCRKRFRLYLFENPLNFLLFSTPCKWHLCFGKIDFHSICTSTLGSELSRVGTYCNW